MRPDPTRDSRRARTARRRAYALAAGAAGVVAAPESDAAIQYFVGNISIPQGAAQPLDMNVGGDDYDDIVLKNYVFGGGNYQGATVPYFPGKLVGFSSGLSYATALAAGALIDVSTLGPSFVGSLAYGASNPNAQFNNAIDAYIGFAFPIGPVDLHFAWIRVDIDNAAGLFLVKDWAYEDQAGVGILAGDTGVQPIFGDFNDDKTVDGADLLAWQRGFGTEYNASDLQDWRDHYGAGLPNAHLTSVAPEPRTLGLLAAGAAGLTALRRRRGPA